jgi:hypothetical protein
MFAFRAYGALSCEVTEIVIRQPCHVVLLAFAPLSPSTIT